MICTKREQFSFFLSLRSSSRLKAISARLSAARERRRESERERERALSLSLACDVESKEKTTTTTTTKRPLTNKKCEVVSQLHFQLHSLGFIGPSRERDVRGVFRNISALSIPDAVAGSAGRNDNKNVTIVGKMRLRSKATGKGGGRLRRSFASPSAFSPPSLTSGSEKGGSLRSPCPRFLFCFF